VFCTNPLEAHVCSGKLATARGVHGSAVEEEERVIGSEINEVNQARVGQVLGGRYELLSLLGGGAQGAVYRASDRKDGDTVAVKVLHTGLATDASARERMFREARALVQLRGTCALTIFDQAFTPEGSLCLVTEFLVGQPMSDYLRNLEAAGQRMPLHVLPHVFQPIAETLDFAHARDIVHRDLKPENIFLSEENGRTRARLLDFGFAKFMRERQITQLGMIAGSPSYIAPESWVGKAVDYRIDLYSFAASIYRALAGQPPFVSESPVQAMRLATTAPRPKLTALRPDLPPKVDDWCEQALAVKPDERFFKARAVWASIAGVLRPLLGH
jgi:serine/threonine-protein kinase